MFAMDLWLGRSSKTMSNACLRDACKMVESDFLIEAKLQSIGVDYDVNVQRPSWS